MRHAAFGLLLVLIVGCASSPNTSQPRWTRAKLVGLKMSLISRTAIEEYTFEQDGYVVTTLGARDGMVTGPIWYWRIRDGRLQIGGDLNKPWDEFTLVAMDDEVITVRRSAGDVVRFRYGYTKRSNQTMKPTRPLRENVSDFATTPSRGLSYSR